MFTQSSNLFSRRQRKAFTLVEILVTIGIIAILAGILVPAVFSAMITTREAAITTETMQLAAAIEDFHNKYHFYPPTFGPGAGYSINTAGSPDQMLNYLNKISRNHNENAVGPGMSVTRLQQWWLDVGSKLDTQSGLVFWLSGVCKNKQFPLTGFSRGVATGQSLSPSDLNRFINGGIPMSGGAELDVEREVFYEFKNAQLEYDAENIAVYNQAYGTDAGSSDPDLIASNAYAYLDNGSYVIGGAYSLGGVFINPDTFQLVSAGMDGKLGRLSDTLPRNVTATDQPTFEHDDNIVNFVPGRFDVFVNDNQ